MKNLIYLSVLFLTVLIIGCKDAAVDPVVPEDTIPTQEQLDNRSIELFNQGKDITEAVNLLIKEFVLKDTVLLKSLYDAGYNPSGIVLVVHNVFGYEARPAEKILFVVLDDETKAQIAELILKEYVPDLKVNREDLKYFIALIPELETKINLLKNNYGESAEETAAILIKTGENVITLIKAVEEQYSLNEDNVKELILRLQLSAKDITGVLLQLYNYTAEAVFDFLNENDYLITEICKALKDNYTITIIQIAELLEKVYPDDVHSILVELKNIGYSYDEIGILLKEYYEYSAAVTAGLLKDINATAWDIAKLLFERYNITLSEIFSILKDLGFNLGDMVIVAFFDFNLTVQEIENIFTELGYDLCDILTIIHIPCP